MGPARLNIWAPFSAGFDIEFADGSSDANSEESQVVVQGMEGRVVVKTFASTCSSLLLRGVA
eukprot:m.437236 g.437236  ORF g.437236 m.437236 type:complete len:62 (-) comp21434_c0_seq8:521-706(-)